MIRRSNYRATLVQALGELIPQAQLATDLVDQAAAARLKVNRTDLRCLGTLVQHGATSAGKLAERVGLTRGAMTTALDRLERAGWVRRVDHPTDGRGVSVEPTAMAKRVVRQIWEPIGKEGMRILDRYSDAELELIRRFFEEYCALQHAHGERIRQLATKSRR